MGRTENFLWTKKHHNRKFFSVFYNIRKDTEIILLQSNVRQIYADTNTIPVNRYNFLMPEKEYILLEWRKVNDFDQV